MICWRAFCVVMVMWCLVQHVVAFSALRFYPRSNNFVQKRQNFDAITVDMSHHIGHDDDATVKLLHFPDLDEVAYFAKLVRLRNEM